jgi:protein-L-isoaspartate O-methyltransferase
VNSEHLRLCSSPEWAAYVADDLLPWVLADHRLGDELLEVGPGPGLTTDILRRHAGHVTAAELDADLAGQLGARLAGTNVEVVNADATRLPFPAARFSIFVPVDPDRLPERLRAAGFAAAQVEVRGDRLRFTSTK